MKTAIQVEFEFGEVARAVSKLAIRWRRDGDKFLMMKFCRKAESGVSEMQMELQFNIVEHTLNMPIL